LDVATAKPPRAGEDNGVVRVAQAARPKAARGAQRARPANARARQRAGGAAGSVQTGGQTNGTLPGEAQGAQELMDLLQNHVAPETWDVNGGPGTMMYFAPKKVLVIRQTGEAHEQLQDLIKQLRR
jgi:hypothetical protein